MEDTSTEIPSAPVDDNGNTKATDSAENFKKFMYEVIDKNGVINDLRAYLRGHLVNLLKSVQTGETPVCQKHFTQRLELSAQALNILIAEYLLRMDFHYSLSVFVSEIPLGNMMFEFAKKLAENSEDSKELRFNNNDLCLILHYLDIPSNSEQIANLYKTYENSDKTSLLSCILKNFHLYSDLKQQDSSQEFIPLSNTSSEMETKMLRTKSADKCTHIVYCKTCFNKQLFMKEKLKKKKQDMVKKVSSNVLNTDYFIKNINSMEKNLIDELFEQMKDVYESEMRLTKQDEEKILRKTLEHQSATLQKKCDDLESSYKAREEALRSSVEHKKRFLVTMARALKRQLHHVNEATRDVRQRTDNLTAKEQHLKAHIADAEKLLRDRSEAMRSQIANEIIVLESHLEAMRKERDTINRERMQLEELRLTAQGSNLFTQFTIENEQLKSQYDAITNELCLLKNYVETLKFDKKCFVERGAGTEGVLNNGRGVGGNNGTPHRVVNQFNKQKNVNFDQEEQGACSDSSSECACKAEGEAEGEAEGGGTGPNARLAALMRENHALREFTKQQRAHIESLEYHQMRLQTQLAERPRTPAPYVCTAYDNRSSGVLCGGVVCNRDGGGEQAAGERASLDRHADPRRYLMWRSLRRRVSPAGVVKQRAAPAVRPHTAPRDNVFRFLAEESNPTTGAQSQQQNNTGEPSCSRIEDTSTDGQTEPTKPMEVPKKDTRSPFSKSIKLKKTMSKKENFKIKSPIKREKSPNTVLREARIRLRKLEIEAEAVEKSYLNFRRRREVCNNINMFADALDKNDQQIPDFNKPTNLDKTKDVNEPNTLNAGLDKYLQEHKKKLDITAAYFHNRNATSIKVKPIPKAYSEQKEEKKNYLETPLAEFRKYYHSEKRSEIDKNNTQSIKEETHVTQGTNSRDDSSRPKSAKSSARKEKRSDKDNEHSKSEHIEQSDNTNQDISHNTVSSKKSKEKRSNNSSSEKNKPDKNSHNKYEKINESNENLLTIDIDNEVKDIEIKETPRQNILLLVESSIDNSIGEPEVKSPQMKVIIKPKSPIDENTDKSPKDKSQKYSPVYKYDEFVARDASENTASEPDPEPEYPDDFSADNNNSPSEYDNLSPASVPKTSEDENFWDS